MPTAVFVPASSNATTLCTVHDIMKVSIAIVLPNQSTRYSGRANDEKVCAANRTECGLDSVWR